MVVGQGRSQGRGQQGHGPLLSLKVQLLNMAYTKWLEIYAISETIFAYGALIIIFKYFSFSI